ncbi:MULTISPECIES: hypothetical protein [Streptomyces]|uniref:Oxidoreductase FAD/NAD(P)-binding domain-containing protein n=1 Tax=Streptomyces venezuelae TaxID=54571 RepID=A0A5P2BKD0_STRVZ|nr:hypothetical protein [Streptomyces venezuelae]MYY87175.1 hypothetical protein [Streptomyces sp. SID335]MYZ17742.1 hypothetical protein [Streptomyces sp. SID337]NDZ85947.1 hypothetical protein [Streptomyces sp. SID10115]NEB47317.1 hypothetical protein [Streptomyces sp. SID339]QES30884.1 hypothetical protein DEJ47_34685 [Streptomyces venezuelae]
MRRPAEPDTRGGHARVQHCRDAFRVPADARTPVIMIGAGTGLAPFRGAIAGRVGFLHDGGQRAPALCHFGCDHPYVDHLHRTEFEAAEAWWRGLVGGGGLWRTSM